MNPCKAKHARFDSADAGAADCIPNQAGEIRKGSYAMLKGHPCKVVDYSTSRPGRARREWNWNRAEFSY